MPAKTKSSLLTKNNHFRKETTLWSKFALFHYSKKLRYRFFQYVIVCSMRSKQQPALTPLGPQDLEHGAALARIQGSLQASQIPRASPGPGKNLPQVETA
jgi:hypothetical protein